MSKFRDQTGNIPPLSLGEGIEASAQPSLQSVSSDNTQTSIQPMKKQSKNMLSDDKKGLTTPATTPKITELTRQHAVIARAALLQLEKAGLLRRFKVLSKDGVQKIRLEFDPVFWTTDLRLKEVLSMPDNTQAPAEKEG